MNLSPDLLKAQFVNGRMCARKILNKKKSLLSFVSNFSISSRIEFKKLEMQCMKIKNKIV